MSKSVFKTWEVIKMLTENPEKEFRQVSDSTRIYVHPNGNYIITEGLVVHDGSDKVVYKIRKRELVKC